MVAADLPPKLAMRVITEVLYKVESDADDAGWDQGHRLLAIIVIGHSMTDETSGGAMIEITEVAVPASWWAANERPGDTVRELALFTALTASMGQGPDVNLLAFAVVAEGYMTRIDEQGASPRIECRNVTGIDRFGMRYWLCHERDSVIHEYLGDDADGDIPDALAVLMAAATIPGAGR